MSRGAARPAARPSPSAARPSPIWLVTLDPGTRRAGIAVHELTNPRSPTAPPRATLVRAVDLLTNRAGVRAMVDEIALGLPPLTFEDAVLVSEWPRKYKTQRAAHADIDGLRAVVEAVEGWGWARTVRTSPSQWKGNVPKHIHHARVGAALDPVDRARVRWDYLGPDARDAVALGRWALGAGRPRVFP